MIDELIKLANEFMDAGKPSRKAMVTLGGRDFVTVDYGTPDSRMKHHLRARRRPRALGH